VTDEIRVTRRTALKGAVGAAAVGVLGGAGPALAAPPREALWRTARRRGLVYGSSWATWQSDKDYLRLLSREAAMILTEDDLLWYRLKPSRHAPLDFSFGDKLIARAEHHRQLVLGAHLVWDEGFGDGWKPNELSSLSEKQARRLLFPIVRRTVKRYRGRVAVWSCVNEAVDAAEADGLRRDVPWYKTIGPSYVAESFRVAHAADPGAMLLLNEFGFETDDEFDTAADKRSATLRVIDALLAAGVPVHGLGVQAHLRAADFAAGNFDAAAYRQFLADVAARGLKILITEMDVLDDGLPAGRKARDRGVAAAYRSYLDAALAQPAVVAVLTFGLSDRYTWLQEDYPRDDGAARRPLPFDAKLRPKPAHRAVSRELAEAPKRPLAWRTRRH
jgi:endo-1,4-beta-xylanase